MAEPGRFPLGSGAAATEDEIRAWLASAAASAYGPARAGELVGAVDATATKLARLARLGEPPPDLEPDLGR